jgi:two-component system sensor histidine kinase KdpD
VITGDFGEPITRHLAKAASQRSSPKEWLLSISSVAVCTGVSAFAFPYLTLVDLAMVYILGIMLVSSRAGKGPSLLATLLSVAAFDFFFVPPYYTFAVSDVKYFFTFAVMFIVAFVISRLTLRVREQAAAARRREKRTAALYNLSRELVHERGIARISAVSVKHIGDVFSRQIVILVPDEWGKLTTTVAGPGAFSLDQNELSVAQWAFDHRKEAGLGTDTLPGAEALYLPLITSSRTVGVLGMLQSPSVGVLDHEQIHVLESFANQIAVAIDRALLSEEAQQALLKAETETLRNTLLSSVSHDLRTPLAAITGAATTLLEKDISLNQSGRQELVQTIFEEAEHLNQIIRNVLNMTRLESGAITVKKEWQPFEEIVGAVLNRLSDKLKDRPLTINLPVDLPLVPFDPLLIEQVLMNLLDNAVRYTPQGTPIELSAMLKEREIVVTLSDRGPGIPAGEEERIFEKFIRGAATGGGIGLGLTICDAIVTAHGGRIWAENRPGGGAVFRFTLPIDQHPPRLDEMEEKV